MNDTVLLHATTMRRLGRSVLALDANSLAKLYPPWHEFHWPFHGPLGGWSSPSVGFDRLLPWLSFFNDFSQSKKKRRRISVRRYVVVKGNRTEPHNLPSPCCGDSDGLDRYSVRHTPKWEELRNSMELVFQVTTYQTVKSEWNGIIPEEYSWLTAMQNYYYVKCNMPFMPEIGEGSSHQTNTGLAWTLAFI